MLPSALSPFLAKADYISMLDQSCAHKVLSFPWTGIFVVSVSELWGWGCKNVTHLLPWSDSSVMSHGIVNALKTNWGAQRTYWFRDLILPPDFGFNWENGGFEHTNKGFQLPIALPLQTVPDPFECGTIFAPFFSVQPIVLHSLRTYVMVEILWWYNYNSSIF